MSGGDGFGGGYAGLTRGQYRLLLVGFVFPLVGALFGLVFAGFALAGAAVGGTAPFVLVPGLALGGWMQVETALAGGRDPARATGAKRRMRALLLVPVVLIPLAVVLALLALVHIPTAVTDLPLAALVSGLIGAAFLPATVKVRGIPWLHG